MYNCDIFCAVVDNYGDIGVCWRLARQLAHEHGLAVRLWVDDLASFRSLCPEVETSQAQQWCLGIEIRHWTEIFPEVQPAQLVIEAFACKLPGRYVAAMAEQEHQPVWINLEYLSAEDWVEGCHLLPSPHPTLPLTKYFFFPGFSPKTGGLLLEHDLLARRDTFQSDTAQQQAFWDAIGVPLPANNTLKVTLFAYENPALHSLFDAWANGTQAVLCLVPEGRILPQVIQYFQAQGERVVGMNPNSRYYSHGMLQVHVLPFVEQTRFDELLWGCDFNFVRGEDSFVRAQWAGKPFAWHIYPQHDGIHLTKLRAFIKLYCTGMPSDCADSLHDLWEVWNRSCPLPEIPQEMRVAGDSGQSTSTKSEQAWKNLAVHMPTLCQHANNWAQIHSANSLVMNLLDFFNSIVRMRDLKILAQASTL